MQPHQRLLRLDDAAAALDARIEAAVGKIEAARAEAVKEGVGLYKEIYDNLVAEKKDLNTRRAVLEAQLQGRLPPVSTAHLEPPAAACGQDAGSGSGSPPPLQSVPDRSGHGPTPSPGAAPSSAPLSCTWWSLTWEACCSPPTVPRWRISSRRACWLPLSVAGMGPPGVIKR